VNLQHTSSCLFKPGGAGIIPTVVQAALDDDELVIAMDSTNAFNTASRLAAFEYLRKHAHTYQEMFPLLNLFYAQASPLHAFDASGQCCLTHHQTSGTLQGCSSSTWFFTLCILERVLIPNINHTISYVDDIYLIRNATSNFSSIVAALAACGLDINPGKTRVLSPRPLPASLHHLQHVSTTTKVAGGIVLVSRSTPHTTLAELLSPIVTSHTQLLTRIISLTAPKQYKLALLQYAQWRHLYLATHSTPEGIRSILSDMDQRTLNAFAELTHRDPLLLQVPLFKPPEDGGLACFPTSALQLQLHARAQLHAMPFLRRFNLPTPSTTPASSPLKALWAAFSTASGQRLTRVNASLFAAPPRHQHLSDEEFTFGVDLLIGCCAPIKYKCRLDQSTDLANLAPTAVHQHLLSCTSCGAPAFHARHREVLNAIHFACKKFNITCELNPKDLPRVNNTRGGPDIMIWHGSTWYAGDVVIGRSLNASYARKMRIYDKFAILTKSETLPIALDVLGRFHKSTWNTFLHLSRGRQGFISTLNELTQTALIRGQFHGFRRLVIRGELGHGTQDDDFSPPSNHASDAEDPDPAE